MRYYICMRKEPFLFASQTSEKRGYFNESNKQAGYPKSGALSPPPCVRGKSAVTTEKYCRDAAAFCLFVNGRPITKELVIAYKENLIDRGYAVRSINSMIASVNSYLRFLGREECKVKNIRTQHQTYCPEEKILTKEDYRLLLAAAGDHPRMYLLLHAPRASQNGLYTGVPKRLIVGEIASLRQCAYRHV